MSDPLPPDKIILQPLEWVWKQESTVAVCSKLGDEELVISLYIILVVANCPLSIIALILTKLFLIPSFLKSTSKTSQDFHNRRFVLRYNYFILIMSKELPTHLISFNSKIKLVYKNKTKYFRLRWCDTVWLPSECSEFCLNACLMLS